MSEQDWDTIRRLADIASRRPEHQREQEIAQALLGLLKERERLRSRCAQAAAAAAVETHYLASLRAAAIAYDDAIQRHADKESWIASDELDLLYAQFILIARAAASPEAARREE